MKKYNFGKTFTLNALKKKKANPNSIPAWDQLRLARTLGFSNWTLSFRTKDKAHSFYTELKSKGYTTYGIESYGFGKDLEFIIDIDFPSDVNN